jgi:exonuclease III
MSYKCFDDDIAQDPLERRRGHAGVAICFKNKLQNFIEPLPDGGNRVIAIRLNVIQPFILVCVYMPTRGGNATLDDYKAVLDELSEIIEKYRSIYDIIIGGDMNASLHRSDRNITHDTVFTEFLEINGLKLPDMCKNKVLFIILITEISLRSTILLKII